MKRRALVRSCGFAAGAAVWVGAATARPQPADPAIAFVAQYSVTTGPKRSPTTTTWNDRTVMNDDGGAKTVVWSRTLDLQLQSFLDVSWSPDLDGNPANGYQGTLAAIARNDGPTFNRNLYLLDIRVIDGVPQATDIRQIVENGVSPNVIGPSLPAWSPDLDALAPGYQGQIAFQGSTDNGQTSNVSVIAVAWNGASVEPVYGPNTAVPLWDPHLGGGTRYPTWSPDGSRIAFAGNGGLSIMDARTGVVLAVITAAGFDPIDLQWSRTGSRVALAQAGTIYTIDVDLGIGSLQALPGAPAGNRWPAWSPDDSAIVFSGKNSRNAKWCVRKVVLATGQQTVLVTSSTKDMIVPDWRPY